MSSLIIIGNCPHFGVGLSLKALLVLSLGVVSGLSSKDVLFGIEGDCGRETDGEWRQGGQAFILVLVNFWTQLKSHCF
jgi:hypothetical protein